MSSQKSTGNRYRWFLTEDKIQQLKRMSDNGVTLTGAARELGVDRKTLLRAADRIGKLQWLRDQFPSVRFTPGSKKRGIPSEYRDCHLRAATMAWR